MTSPVNVDIKLGVNKFNVDENNPHIVLKTEPDKQALEVLIKACPAGLYKKQDDGSVRFDYAGCLECGTCRFSAWTACWKSGNTRAVPLAWSFATVD
ncbi:ferredoxin like protein FixX [Salmonella enterica subsp. arizonae]|uniref:Ferredoxin like protein FixX n=1 Tax=Salmonella enterica subsp. arizonae TaxID=59203 RepID=A0A447R9P0_SALER|nr:ferredoxin like protein FixX [Salmonella enterica subsp. arizonae]